MSREPSAKVVVAIDGPAGAGKSTVAKAVAGALGYSMLDTGALYRAVALVSHRRGVAWDDAEALGAIARDLDVEFHWDGTQNHIRVEGEDVSEAIRTPEMARGASTVSAVPEVRAGLLDLQRRLGASGGVVAEGRDIGTVVFPDAQAKFFLTASTAVRADRRLAELTAKGVEITREELEAQIRERDERDSSRAVAPLTAADDAVVLDSSALGIDAVVERILAVVRDRITGA